MNLTSRRAFLERLAACLPAMVCARNLRGWGQGTSAAVSQRAWMTAGSDRYREIKLPYWQPASSLKPELAESTIEVDPSQSFQNILGFGGAFTDSSCYLFSRMDPSQRRQLLRELFSPTGLQLSVARTCMGSSDYSRTAYTFDDNAGADPELSHFSIEHDCAYILPTLREAVEIQPELFFFSTPWSPPAWMKTGDSLFGGSMRKHYFDCYARYFVKFINAY